MKLQNQLFIVLTIFTYSVHSVSVQSTQQCPLSLPRNKYLATFGNVCYQFVNSEVKWTSAKTYCAQNGGILVKILNQDQQNFLFNYVTSIHWNKHGLWIGANDRDKEGQWMWSTGERLAWGNWHSGQGPTSHHGFIFSSIIGSAEDCGVMRLDDGGKWHDYPCSGLLYHYTFICQYEISHQSVSTSTVATHKTTVSRHIKTSTGNNYLFPSKSTRGIITNQRVNITTILNSKSTMYIPTTNLKKELVTKHQSQRSSLLPATAKTITVSPRTSSVQSVITRQPPRTTVSSTFNRITSSRSPSSTIQNQKHSKQSTILLPNTKRNHQTTSGKSGHVTNPSNQKSRVQSSTIFKTIQPSASSKTISTVPSSMKRHSVTSITNQAATGKTASLTQKKTRHHNSSSHTGVYVGVSVGAVGALAIVLLGIFMIRRKMTQTPSEPPTGLDNPVYGLVNGQK